MKATFQHYQDGGHAGPRQTVEIGDQEIMDAALAWSEAQTGHPWDGILAVEDDGTAHEFKYSDGSIEAV